MGTATAARRYEEHAARVLAGAARFAVATLRQGARPEYATFGSLPEAVLHARGSVHRCLYAVDAAGRSVLIEPGRWDELTRVPDHAGEGEI